MRRFHRIIVILMLFFSSNLYAMDFFVEGLDWRATETNDWAYLNSKTVPNQTIDYKTIDFSYRPGFRIGAIYHNNFDALFSYTYFYTNTHDAATGNIRPSFLGSVTVTQPTGYLFQSGQVQQTIQFNMFDLDIGKPFHPTEKLTLHPIVGLMGGWINQSIHAQYGGSVFSDEKLTNDFAGVGPKVGVDVDINLFHEQSLQPKIFASFATAYLYGHWGINDDATAIPADTVYIEGGSHNMAAFAIQAAAGIKIEYKQIELKLVYEMSDWFDQSQFFDNDTGAHNNDLALQGLTLGLTYRG